MRRSLMSAYSLMMMNRGRAPAVDPLSSPVTANLQLFLSASSLTAADGDPIQTWPDLSGNNNNATQGVLANRPLYKPNVINGRPVLRFDGINDGYALASTITSNPATVYIVQSTTDTAYVLIWATTSHNSYVAQLSSTATSIYANFGTPTAYRNGALQSWVNRKDVYDALNGSPYIVSLVNADFSLWTAGLNIGNFVSPWTYAGDLAAILIYSGAHSTADRTAVENWLKEVYGLS